MHLLQYAQKTFAIPLDELPLTEADLCLLNELAYLPLDDIAEDHRGFARGISAAQIYQEFVTDSTLRTNWFLATNQRLQLLKMVATSPRFAALRFFHYQAHLDATEQVQFAALTLVVPGVFRQVVFRGTDDSLVGWKEDFHLAAQKDIPSQLLAVNYLEDNLKQAASTPIYVTGHSKGGHLAVFATAAQPQELERRVESVLAFDAPGFIEAFLKNPGYLRLLPKIRDFIPEDSIVGRLMFRKTQQEVVASGGIGLMQHSVFFWQVDETGTFKPKDATTGASERVAKVTGEWLTRHAPEDIEKVVDVCFDLAMGEGYGSLLDIGIKVLPFIQLMRAKTAELEPETAELVSRLADDYVQLWKEQKKAERQQIKEGRAVPAWLAAPPKFPQKLLMQQATKTGVPLSLQKLLERDAAPAEKKPGA